jgi:hypothetical protein
LKNGRLRLAEIIATVKVPFEHDLTEEGTKCRRNCSGSSMRKAG